MSPTRAPTVVETTSSPAGSPTSGRVVAEIPSSPTHSSPALAASRVVAETLSPARISTEPSEATQVGPAGRAGHAPTRGPSATGRSTSAPDRRNRRRAPSALVAARPALGPHSMVTRADSSIVRPIERLNLSAMHSTISPIPRDYRSAMTDIHWRAAMTDEYQALMDSDTWTLVPRPPGANVVSGKWLFKHKFHSDGTLPRHKARWVVRGFS